MGSGGKTIFAVNLVAMARPTFHLREKKYIQDDNSISTVWQRLLRKMISDPRTWRKANSMLSGKT
jgi:hypothetical protein